jgi:hypothetical protein
MLQAGSLVSASRALPDTSEASTARSGSVSPERRTDESGRNRCQGPDED